MAGRRYPQKSGNAKRTAYTAAQRKAYETGRAYRLGRAGKEIKFRNVDNKASFSAGYSSVDLANYKNVKGKKNG